MHARKNAPQDIQPLTWSFEDAGFRIGCGRSMVYDLVAAGELKAIKFGRSNRIPESECAALVARRLKAAA